MKKLILEGFPPSHAVYVDGSLAGQAAVSAEGHRPSTIDPSEAMREALGPDLADRCMGRVGHVPGEAELASADAYWQAVRIPPVDALRTWFDMLDQYGDATLGISPGSLSDPSVLHSENLFRLWHQHANRAYRLYLADIIREDRMCEQVALSRKRMAKERTPMCFWLSQDDALNMVPAD